MDGDARWEGGEGRREKGEDTAGVKPGWRGIGDG